jgi:hypothetical protein
MNFMACLAECLSELVSIFQTITKSPQKLEELRPLSIVAAAAKRHLKINIEPNDLFLMGLTPFPTKAAGIPVFVNSPTTPLSSSDLDVSKTVANSNLI